MSGEKLQVFVVGIVEIIFRSRLQQQDKVERTVVITASVVVIHCCLSLADRFCGVLREERVFGGTRFPDFEFG